MEKIPTKFSNRKFFQRLVQKTQQILNPAGATNFLQIEVLKAFIDRMHKDSKKPISSNQQEKKLSRKRRVFEYGENSHGRKELKKRKTNKEEEVKKKEKSKDDNFDDIPKILSSKLQEKIDEKRGTNVKLVITKRLFNTDLNTHHDRLTIPANQVKAKCDFLTEEEKASIDQRNALDVKLIEPCYEESYMKFVKWNSKKSYSYILRSSWNDVLKRNSNLKLNDVIQLWSFRVNGELRFAIQKVRDAQQTSTQC